MKRVFVGEYMLHSLLNKNQMIFQPFIIEFLARVVVKSSDQSRWPTFYLVLLHPALLNLTPNIDLPWLDINAGM